MAFYLIGCANPPSSPSPTKSSISSSPIPSPALWSATSTPPELLPVFEITGAVAKPLSFTWDELRALPLIHSIVEHPNTGSQEFEGVSLLPLLELAKPLPGAHSLLLWARNGQQVEISLEDLQKCRESMLAFEERGLSLILPGVEAEAWMQKIARIEVR